MKQHPLALAIALAMPSLLTTPFALADDNSVFQLGVVEVSGKSLNSMSSPSSVTISEDEMQAHQDVSVADTLARQSGVILSSGSRRAESWAFIRGFDSRQVTLNIDGIPVYIPYDGNIDLNRFLVADMSQIVVSKGLGSLLYGPNNMGGSINLISRKPQKELEGRVTAGVGFGGNGLANNNESLQVGSKVSDQFYVQGGVSRADSNGFPMSSSFTPTAAQPSGDRFHSDSTSTTGNVKFGFTPNATDEYAISYYSTRGRKGAAPYAGTTTVNKNLVYWDWPQWDKDSVYFISHTAVGTGYIKSRLYLDTFQNSLTMFKDAKYVTTMGRSRYDDSSQGMNLEYGQPLGDHLIKVAGFYKQDKHRETDLPNSSKSYESPWLQYRTETTALGIEDEWKLSPTTRLSFGYRKDWMSLAQAQEYGDAAKTQVKDMSTLGQKNLDNLQAFVLHDWKDLTWRVGMAHKGRYPSIKEMYSYKLGTAIPNPLLQAEQVLHHEMGVSGKLGTGRFDAAAYYSRVNDAIESVSLNSTTSQMQNVGKANHYGIDLSFLQPLGQSFSWQLNYGWLKKELSNASLVATGMPEQRLYSTLAWYANAALELDADIEYAGKRQTTTDGLRPVADYTLFHLRGRYDINPKTYVNAGIYNLMDTNYQISEGDPMPGRMAQVSLTHKF